MTVENWFQKVKAGLAAKQIAGNVILTPFSSARIRRLITY
jgi:hypothetical protein